MNLNISLTHLYSPLHNSNFHKKLELKHTVSIVALSVFTCCVFSLAGAGAIPAAIIGLGSFYSLTAALKTLGFTQYTEEDHEVDLAAYQDRTIVNLFYKFDRSPLNKVGILWEKNRNNDGDTKQVVLPEGWTLQELKYNPFHSNGPFTLKAFALLDDQENPRYIVRKSYKFLGLGRNDKDFKIWEVENSQRNHDLVLQAFL
ncbi:MAG: hypothetical protein Tsb0021_07780 [Chlamydiales bacterium]